MDAPIPLEPDVSKRTGRPRKRGGGESNPIVPYLSHLRHTRLTNPHVTDLAVHVTHQTALLQAATGSGRWPVSQHTAALQWTSSGTSSLYITRSHSAAPGSPSLFAKAFQVAGVPSACRTNSGGRSTKKSATFCQAGVNWEGHRCSSPRGPSCSHWGAKSARQ